MIPINTRALKYGLDMLTIENNLKKKDAESKKEWLKRISGEIYETYSCYNEIDLLQDTNKFENVGIYLFNTLIRIAGEENSVVPKKELIELFSSYKNRRAHTQIQTLKMFDLIAKPGAQAETRIILLSCFKVLQYYLMFYVEKGYIPTSAVLENWVESIKELPSYLIKPYKVKLNISTDPEAIKKYAQIKKLVGSSGICNVRCIMEGKPVLCSREKGHEGVHVARIPIVGVIAVWEE